MAEVNYTVFTEIVIQAICFLHDVEHISANVLFIFLFGNW